MDIKVIGEGCEKCTKLFENTVDALKELNIEAKVEKVEDLMDIIALGVMTTPTIMINGKAKAMGQVLSTEKVKALLKKEL